MGARPWTDLAKRTIYLPGPGKLLTKDTALKLMGRMAGVRYWGRGVETSMLMPTSSGLALLLTLQLPLWPSW